MNIGFTGSRSIKKLTPKMIETLEILGIFDTLIHGGARGADTLVEDYLLGKGMRVRQIRPVNPSIKTHYLYRNIEIITQSDYLIAFWDGASSGTKFVIDYAKARGKNVVVVYG